MISRRSPNMFIVVEQDQIRTLSGIRHISLFKNYDKGLSQHTTMFLKMFKVTFLNLEIIESLTFSV